MFSFGAKKKTRGATALAEREKYLKMPLADKRKEYKCGNNYTTLESVPTWPEVYEENKERMQRLAKKRLFKPKETYEVNHELNKKITIWKGDITTLEIDAIVNAANNSLLGGGGVDGAIHSAAGSSLKSECAPLGGCDTGDAKITGGFKLPSKYVIHTVGPIGSDETKLRSCYTKCLKILKSEKLKSVAFPCISTGIYGYPNDQAAPVALETARKFLEENHKEMDRIIFCLFMKVDVTLYEEMMQWYFPLYDPLQTDKQSEGKDKATAAENSTSAAAGDDEEVIDLDLSDNKDSPSEPEEKGDGNNGNGDVAEESPESKDVDEEVKRIKVDDDDPEVTATPAEVVMEENKSTEKTKGTTETESSTETLNPKPNECPDTKL